MVQVAVGGCGKLEGAEADIVESLIVNAHDLISVLNQLMYGESGVVWLDDGIRHLRRWHDRECAHHAVGVLFTDLGDEECTHTGSCTSSQGVCNLEALQAVAALCLLSDDIKDGVDELSSFCIVTLGPVVT